MSEVVAWRCSHHKGHPVPDLVRDLELHSGFFRKNASMATLLDWANSHFWEIIPALVVLGLVYAAGISRADYPGRGQSTWLWRQKVWSRIGEYGLAMPFAVLLVGGLALILLDKIGV
jgi:hypothetical protein